MPRDPGVSYASDTRQLGRADRLTRGQRGGPPGWVVLVIVVLVAAGVAYALVR